MHPVTHAWLEGLRETVAESRRTAAPEDTIDPAAAAAERMILAAHLATWIDDTPGLLAARRAWAGRTPDADAEAAVVLTTSPRGVALAEEFLARGDPLTRDLRPRVCCATESEYRRWCMRHPDAGHLLHVNHWSWIKTSVPRQRDAEFARHPLHAGEHYWLHRTGTAGAGAADGRTAHLWKFTGRHAALLEAFVAERSAAPPRA
jgi:hypothetical protein